MNTLDLVLVIPLFLGFVFGLSKGLIREIISLAVIFFGVYVAKWFSPFGVLILTRFFDFSETLAKPVSFVLIFILVAFVLMIVAKTLDKLVNTISLGGLNKFFGGVFGLLKYALLISLLLNVLHAIDSKFTIIKPVTKSESVLYEPLRKFAPILWDEVKEVKSTQSEKE